MLGGAQTGVARGSAKMLSHILVSVQCVALLGHIEYPWLRRVPVTAALVWTISLSPPAAWAAIGAQIHPPHPSTLSPSHLLGGKAMLVYWKAV